MMMMMTMMVMMTVMSDEDDDDDDGGRVCAPHSHTLSLTYHPTAFNPHNFEPGTPMHVGVCMHVGCWDVGWDC